MPHCGGCWRGADVIDGVGNKPSQHNAPFGRYRIPNAGFSVIGLWDDWRGVSSTLRLICYIAARVALRLPRTAGGEWWAIVVTGLAVAWCINLVNFMNGVDGLVTVHALCTAVAWFDRCLSPLAVVSETY